jgi:succinyl-CoA synthetase alpha subunit
MSVLVNKSTRVICKGFSGSKGTFHLEQAIADNRRPIPQEQQ